MDNDTGRNEEPGAAGCAKRKRDDSTTPYGNVALRRAG